MAKNFIQPGHTLRLVLTGNTPSGTLFQHGSMVAVALVDIPAGESGACTISGVYEVPKAAGVAITALQKVYITPEGVISATGTDNEYAGVAAEDAAAASATVMLLLNGLPS